MASLNDKEREEKALDALLAAAYLMNQMEEDMPDFDGPEPVLSKEDQEALDNLGPDLIERIVTWELSSQDKKHPTTSPKPREEMPELAGALNRGEDDLSEEARDEIERRIKEADEEDEEPEKR